MAEAALLTETPTDRRRPAYVRWLQGALNKTGGSKLTVDGAMGPSTTRALRSFQQSKGLVPDGLAGPRTEAALVRAGAEPAPTAGGRTSAAGLLKREARPPRTTLYLGIALGGEQPAKPMTGVFIPERYQPWPDQSRGSRVDLVLFLHGFKREEPRVSIDAYWNSARHSYRALREGVNDSHKNLVLVAPTLGPRSQAGRLVEGGGFDWYLDRVTAALTRDGPWAEAGLKPYVGDVILACHSGGGLPMRILAMGAGKYAAAVRECWGFDCLYNQGDLQRPGDADLWARWAKTHPQSRLYVHYQVSTTTQSELLEAKRLPNVSVQKSHARGHDWVPITHWGERIQRAGFLRQL